MLRPVGRRRGIRGHIRLFVERPAQQREQPVDFRL